MRTFYAATPGVTLPSQATPVALAAGETVEGIDIHPGAKGSAPATLVATAAHPPVLGEPFTIDVTVTGGQGRPDGLRLGGHLPRGRDVATPTPSSTPPGTPR